MSTRLARNERFTPEGVKGPGILPGDFYSQLGALCMSTWLSDRVFFFLNLKLKRGTYFAFQICSARKDFSLVG